MDVKIGDVTLPKQLQSRILVRFLKEGEAKALLQSYEDAKLRRQYLLVPPTELQKKMAADRKAGMFY